MTVPIDLQRLPENVLADTVACLDNKRDLVNLAKTSRLFYNHAVERLYSSLILVDGKFNLLPDSANVTLNGYIVLPAAKFSLFLRSLRDSPYLVGLIHRFLICPHRNKIDGLGELVELLVESKLANCETPLAGLREFRHLNETYPYKFLYLKREYIRSRKTRTRFVSQNEGEESYSDSLDIASPLVVPLQSYQLVNFTELNEVSPETRHICINTTNRYQDSGFVLTDIVSHVFKNLKSLDLFNPGSAECFLSQASFENVQFESLTRLSLNLTDFAPIELVPQMIQLSYLESFELKFKQSSFNAQNCEKNLQLMELFYHSFKNLRNLSLVHLNPNNLMKNSTWQAKHTFEPSNFSFCVLDNIQAFDSNKSGIRYLNLSMNNFSMLPPLSLDAEDMKSHFVIDQQYLFSKTVLFQRLLVLSSLETLIIPDYLYHWKPFLKLSSSGEVTTTGTMQPSQFLFEGCSCQDCADSRELIKLYAARLNLRDCSVASAYNFLVSILFKRLNNFETNSGLDLLEYPLLNSVEISNFGYLDLELHRISCLILDNMRDDLGFFLASFPRLKELCLGGILLHIERNGDVATLRAPYDGWSCQITRADTTSNYH